MYERAKNWYEGIGVTEKDLLLTTLYKYLIRINTRCTPFGLFASGAVGKVASSSGIDIGDREHFIKHVTLDIENLIKIRNWICSQPDARSELKLFLNTSLYLVGKKYRYTEKSLGKDQLQHFITAIDFNKHLNRIFHKAENGITITQLK